MTKQEAFKRRIRERMTKTGERYGAARRALLRPDHAGSLPAGRHAWVAKPQQPQEVILSATARDWDDWVDLIDAGPGRDAGHTAIASWLVDDRVSTRGGRRR